jgi:hypothetical protein
MSNTIDTHMSVFKYQDPLMDLEKKAVYTVERSAANHKIKTVEAYQYSSNGSQVNFVYNPPQGVIISRNIRTVVEFEFTINAPLNDDDTPLLQLGSNDSFLMLEYGIQTANLNIDNGQNQYLPADVFPLYHRYMSTKDLNEHMGYTFNTPDLCYDYSLPVTTIGSAYNVNSYFGEQGFGDDNLHGRYLQSQITVLSNTNLQAVVNVRFVTPIFLTPLDWRNNVHMQKGLFGVERIIYNIQFKQQLYKWVFAHSTLGNAISSINYRISKVPQLLVQEYSPQPDVPLPLNVIAYNYSQIISRANSFGASVPAGPVTYNFTSNSDQVNGTPSFISFYIRRQENDINYDKPKTALRITGIDILFDTINILNLAAPEQIYEICKKNGYNGTYEDWYTLSGSFIRLKLPTDIPVGALDAVGRLIRHNVQIKCYFENQTNETYVNPELIVMYEYTGMFSKQQNYGQGQINIVSPEDVLRSSDLPELPKDLFLLQKHYGGISLSEIYQKAKTYGPAAYNLAKKCGPEAYHLIRDIVSNGHGRGVVGGGPSSINSANASGYDDMYDDNDFGSGITGGRVVNKRKLRKRISNY